MIGIRSFRRIAFVVACAAAMGGCGSPQLVGDPAVGVSVGKVLKGIRCEFVAYVNGKTGTTRFRAVKPWVIQGKLIVSVVNDSSFDAGGTLKSFAGGVPFGIGFEGGVATKDTSSLTIDFSLNPGDKPPTPCDVPQPGFGLAQWLDAVEEAKTGTAGLILKDKAYAFGLNFGVISKAGVNASFGVQPVSINASALRKRDDVQNLTIAIKPAADREIIYYQEVPTARSKSNASPEFGGDGRAAPTRRLVPVRGTPDLGAQLIQKQRELLGIE